MTCIEWDDLVNLHSGAYNNYLSKGVIKVFDKGTIDEYWDYEVFNKNNILNGSWDVMIYKFPEYYGNSWSWHGYANYLKASVNPETGNSAPFQTIFSVRPYDPWNTQEDQYEYAPVWDWYHWTATRESLTASLNQW